MSHSEASTSFVRAYLKEIFWPFLVTVYPATLFCMLAFVLLWWAAFTALLFVGAAYAFFVGRLCVKAMGNRGVIRYALHIMLAMATQIIFFKVVFSTLVGVTGGTVGFIVMCAAGPLGTWIGPVLLDVVRLQARPSHAC
jgi:hypothetical protein